MKVRTIHKMGVEENTIPAQHQHGNTKGGRSKGTRCELWQCTIQTCLQQKLCEFSRNPLAIIYYTVAVGKVIHRLNPVSQSVWAMQLGQLSYHSGESPKLGKELHFYTQQASLYGLINVTFDPQRCHASHYGANQATYGPACAQVCASLEGGGGCSVLGCNDVGLHSPCHICACWSD